jgi:hypothetical protein
MIVFERGVGLAITVLAFGLMGPAAAQENLDLGKTGAQIFASDCALCHKSPQALNKSGGMFGLSGFLREHYTASRETADVVAKYLESLPNAPAPAKRGAPKRNAKGDDKAKPDDKKPVEKKTEEKKPDDQKVDEKKPTAKSKDKKSAEPKDAKTEPNSDAKAESKPESKPKSSGAKSSDAKPAAPKTSKSKPDKPKTEKKPDKQEKAD